MIHLKCEIEFLPVGEGSKAGDAIVIRYGNVDAYELMLIDAGHAATGSEIVSHLKKYFGPNPILTHVVLTHSDADHASGLRTVLQEIEVKNVWLHVPWLLAEETCHLFKDKRWTPEGLSKNIKENYNIISDIYDLAVLNNCNVCLPFAGDNIGPFKVMSPSRYAYCYLLPQFEKTPEPDQEAIKAAQMWLGKETLVVKAMEAVKAAVQSWTTENWGNERLKDGGITSASNESSVVMYGSFELGNVLLTGDAGINGLNWAAEQAVSSDLPLQQFSFVQIPHHGSRRNVGPAILTRLLGDKQEESDSTRFTAFVSAPKDDDQHPRRIVINAFRRRGGKVIATQGRSKIHYGGFPRREGYSAAEPLPFFTQVEEYT
nr:MBL fold metallo-hydrolase [uncultured Neokomagataea sp.]